MDKMGNFKITKAVNLSEIHCTLTELEHIPSGAKVMHLGNDDPENLFCLSFQTVPQTSNGVAHILEHTVLCGSKKFPIKDPFFAMTRRSLNTFMNALTGSDFTCYPAASQVKKDFYNLLDVYIDAVFHPILDKRSFQQEGHRFEFNEKGELVLKGIVFNEMKGAMSTPDSRLSEIIHTELYPDITYGINSGGDPKVIPSLTYEMLKQFHETYYHPSRCLFFFYGDLPLQEHLDFIDKGILSQTSKAPPLPKIAYQKSPSAPKHSTHYYPVAADEKLDGKTLISFGWVLCPIEEQEQLLALTVIETALFGTDAAPLKLALLRSGLCTNVASFIDPDIIQPPFVITLRGCEPENNEKLEDLLKATLNKIVKEGIPPSLIENAMHQIEFHRTEITGDHGPYGLTLFMRSALLKQHGVEPESGLQIHALFHQLRIELKNDPRYLEKMIQKYLLENPHSIRIPLP